jgi:quercetin dioxygenase-like cupin family protein
MANMKNTHSSTARRQFIAGALGMLGVARLSYGDGIANKPHPGLARGRPHTDFVQAQVVPSRVLGPTNSQPGVLATPLSYNAAGDKAVTVIFKYPAGWAMERPHYVNSDQEFLVLAGQLEFNDVVYGAGDYAYLPAGYPHQTMRSSSGATMLNFYEGEHLAFYADAPPGMYKPARLIKRIATREQSWQPAREAGDRALGGSVSTQLLRQDSDNGERTWLVRVAADKPNPAPRRPVVRLGEVEELFVIDGQIDTPLGMMHRGAYAWRAPGTERGPYGSRSGYTALLRSKGGAPQARSAGRRQLVLRDVRYAPSLVKAQQDFAFKTFDPSLPL